MGEQKVLVLCFDGTGNYFTGSDEDTNILKIYRMLDKHDPNQIHYYQPGIGTYLTTSSVSDTSLSHRIKSKIDKIKDSALGTHLADHVMGGYRFLMENYKPGADVYFFGFSRGAYTARFLAQMIHEIGLLSVGNEEMRQFAWNLFQEWARRTPEEKKKSVKTLNIMRSFKKTFGQDCKLKFIGCFDTVFSVPRFESAWMSRSKYPYAARTGAKVMRHAVSIDERRAKFRQHLMTEDKPKKRQFSKDSSDGEPQGPLYHQHSLGSADDKSHWEEKSTQRRRSSATKSNIEGSKTHSNERNDTEASSPDGDRPREEQEDILEVWFPGCHTDIGGGWGPEPGEPVLLSHVPLVWMVREARRAGLRFNEDMVHELHCSDPESSEMDEEHELPELMVQSSPGGIGQGKSGCSDVNQNDKTDNDQRHPGKTRLDYSSHLERACGEGRTHDALEFRLQNGIMTGKYGFSMIQALGWNIMEYIPFRRMDLRKDGSWRARRWPLPMGEVRDIPYDALIHRSAIARMSKDERYRPGNLILGGGGGRGRRIAPKKAGTGRWKVDREEGDIVGECFVRDIPQWADGSKYPKRHQVHWDGRVWTCRRSHRAKEDRMPSEIAQWWEEVKSSFHHEHEG